MKLKIKKLKLYFVAELLGGRPVELLVSIDLSKPEVTGSIPGVSQQFRIVQIVIPV